VFEIKELRELFRPNTDEVVVKCRGLWRGNLRGNIHLGDGK
jgi:hypothetical protein